MQGGLSKCHICEEIECLSDIGTCQLQLQGVSSTEMAVNVPVVSDTAWAVGGTHRRDYGASTTTHLCVFSSGGHCLVPHTTDYSNCTVRCFGHGFTKPPLVKNATGRSIIDTYIPKRWDEDGSVDLWEYPQTCAEAISFGRSCTINSTNGVTPSFNPQGFTFTLTGTPGKAGFRDGNKDTALFNFPQGIVSDEFGNLFVADTKNNAIRMVNSKGVTTTIAGKGPTQNGYQDGDCSIATFSQPKSLDVRYDTVNGFYTRIIVVADTGNHRIRRIDSYLDNTLTAKCIVKCLSGLCGNDTTSFTDYHYQATPYAGYADGAGTETKMSAPEGIVFMDDGNMVVADTGNWLIRWVLDNGTTYTLAGEIGPGPADEDGNPAGGCPPPCLVGVPGYRDGSLNTAQFWNPIAVARGPNTTIYVSDENRIRLIELPHKVSEIYTIRSTGRVSTVAGTSYQGYDDGVATEATFFNPDGIVMTADNIAYVVDVATCKLRRITPMPLVAESLTCSSQAKILIRPSGCVSYDPPIDAIGRKISYVEKNIRYNYGDPYETDPHRDHGKYIKNCVGVPPLETLDKRWLNITGDNLVIDDHRLYVNEFSEQGMEVIVYCPKSCSTGSGKVYGNHWYGVDSSVCLAAIHDGVISSSTGGYVRLEFQRRFYIHGPDEYHYNSSKTRNGITSLELSSREEQIFKMVRTNISVLVVHTISGHPVAHLTDGCGYQNAQPPQAALFQKPHGIAANREISLTNNIFLYIADSGNHVIRGVSAVCSQICENGGVCVKPDTCQCPSGWTGVDCTIPTCSTPCGKNKVCTSPNTCTCKPGYGGTNCDVPQCIQTCHNGGVCSAPDTCTCANGWFDTNCTTPVCSLTCANGGNCTAPDICACPSDWEGLDCRIPVCNFECYNGGQCVAPATCKCPPQYTGFNCANPVCTQGFFKANPTEYPHHLYSTDLRHWEMYKPCNLAKWCYATNEFECYQDDLQNLVIELPSGGSNRAITGRKNRPTQCMQIELPPGYIIPYELLYADNSTTGNRRYAPNVPYTSNDLNPWRGYTTPTEGHTGPWTYSPDRQIAYVQWVNVTQGVYVCANGGNCTAPDVCECADGWMGFDCRTPICNQGYHFPEQTHYISGLETQDELYYFLKFMGNNSYRLQWPYSNPNYTMQWEYYTSPTNITREFRDHGGERYLGPADWSGLFHGLTYQGGYRCSIRAMTDWENREYINPHPNFYSRYMDPRIQKDGIQYTNWTGMEWPPVHQKSRIFVAEFNGIDYIYTNEGYRLMGIWNRTYNKWEYGTCIIEFNRNCSTSSKDYDLQSKRYDADVQDTDLAFRARVTYDSFTVTAAGRWIAAGGECVDEVKRGCFNNGTCVAPNKCQCASGWTGYDCHIPLCPGGCKHNGNCTLPNTCTCELGWKGPDCSIPICAQECQNGGYCVAPDTCKCLQWPTIFRDGRQGGGRPLFRKANGDPQDTGWTGYDCSVPICVQAKEFLFNTARTSSAHQTLGGHGGDNLLTCVENGRELPRCPVFDVEVTSNDGRSFQTGCGYDPIDTGCCTVNSNLEYSCYRCDPEYRIPSEHTYFCRRNAPVVKGFKSEFDKFSFWLTEDNEFKMCGKYHSPRRNGKAVYYKDEKSLLYSSHNYKSNLTSDRFLCNIRQWVQGDYVDDADLGDIEGVGSIYGLKNGRHVRINYPNIIGEAGTEDWVNGPEMPGEGIYACENEGSCLGPDLCSCTDGYEGYDCSVPLCRHLQPSGQVTGCLNGGVCVSRDNCNCVQTDSVLYLAHTEASRGLTGWTGSDCSMPMCVQGYFDPFCTDLPQAPGGEGCYRCANGGNCTAPEVCTCAEGWTGYDCRTPICEVVADPLTRTQLPTIFEEKIIEFESDPCGLEAIYGVNGYRGRKFTRGNCTQPNKCTCLCKERYNVEICDAKGKYCNGAWQDPMWKYRDVLSRKGVEFIFGTTDCFHGYEGNMDSLDYFVTCHSSIFRPNPTERDSIILILCFSILGFTAIIFWSFVRRRLQKRYLLAKIERRRSKRSSEESLLQADTGAFGHK